MSLFGRSVPMTLLVAAIAFAIGCLWLPAPSQASSPPPMNMPNMNTPNMQQPSAQEEAFLPDSAPATSVSGRDWSIFNHRGAGFFVLLWGLTAMISGLQWPRRTWVRFVPPLAMLGLVEFLILRNDPKAWPNGPYGFWISFRDPSTFQHRVFVLLIFLIALIELLRAADKLSPAMQRYALPLVVVVTAVYLFFHKHGGPGAQQMMQHITDPSMASSPDIKSMLASMKLVKGEHLWFSITGFGLAGAKLLADTGRLGGRLGATLWTLFAIALGFYMMVGYTE